VSQEPNRHYNVLIIDDEADVREVVVEALRLHPIPLRVYEASDGAQGLAKINIQKFDIVITDLNMPKMDGKTLIRELKNVAKDYRPDNIIVASGLVEKDILKEGPGGVSVIKKPFAIEDLIKYISVLLDAKVKATKKAGTPPKKAEKKAPSLNVEFINPFIDAALEVLRVMASVEAHKDFLFIKEDNQNLGDITGIIPISSDKYIGSMAITFPEDVYLKVMNSMLGEEYTEIDDENQDGVAELCNQIFGNAKAVLARMGHKLDMTLPTVITGKGHTVKHAASNGTVLGVYFKTPFGLFVIECLVVNK
jgi:chemotaxis protein CheX